MLSRHSTRAFLSKPVPQNVLEEVLALAQNSPSNSNLQPWRLKVLSGPALQRLSNELLDAFASGQKPTTEPIPNDYKHYRSELGHVLYGPNGYNVDRSNEEGTLQAQKRNYSFFDAPIGVIVCMDKRLAPVDTLSIGMYLQTVCLLLSERGLAHCVQVSIAGYPDVVRKTLGIDEGMEVLTGMAIGYEDESSRLNRLGIRRDVFSQSVEFMCD